MIRLIIDFNIVITITSCSSKNEPVGTVKDFAKTLEAKDFDKMADYVTKDYKKIVDDMKESYGSMSTPKADEFTFTLVKNEEGFAEVNIEEKKHKDLPLKPYTTFFLKKDDGKWYIYNAQAIK